MRRGQRIAVASAIAAISIVLLNASALAPTPTGHSVIVAQRGISEVLDRRNLGLWIGVQKGPP